MILSLNLGENSYDIIVERGALSKIKEHLNLERKVLILTDSGVPSKYSQAVFQASKNGFVYTIKSGEASKSLENYSEIISFMIENSFTRTDAVVSVGGGVVGDLGGFVASTYMRGIDFYNVPTTLLSQLDSSIGGKTAIDFNGVKNVVGAFYQPKRVVIDSDTLKTLDRRQLMAGLCEAIKMAATSSCDLFELIEKSENLENDLDKIIVEGLKIKKDVVEKDPKEKNLRKVLNFGHTIGHAIESASSLGALLHGECVAIGMLPMCALNVRARVENLLKKYELPTESDLSIDVLMSYIQRDKKAKGDKITVIYVEEIGSYEMIDIDLNEMKKYLDGGIL